VTIALSPFRFAWRVRSSSPFSYGREGRAFRTIRKLYGLGSREVARGWGVRPLVVECLEAGGLRFSTPADMNAALAQLWIWAVEKNPEIAR
jgi:hypothetical protein